MKETHIKTCAPTLRDLLDTKRLTIAHQGPKIIRDLLIPSKLKACEGEKNVEHHEQNIPYRTALHLQIVNAKERSK